MSELVLNAQDKVTLIRGYLERYGLRTMIETGLWNGRGSGMQCLDLLDTYIAIDYQAENCRQARAADLRVLTYCGSSADLAKLLDGPLRHSETPTLFWLDAHAVSEDEGAPPNPLLAELDAILAWPHHPTSVVLIDDVRMMGDRDWPTLDSVYEKVGGRWEAHLADDVLRLTPYEN